MIEGLFFNRINAKTGRPTVGGEDHFSRLTRAHETKAPVGPRAVCSSAGTGHTALGHHPAYANNGPICDMVQLHNGV